MKALNLKGVKLGRLTAIRRVASNQRGLSTWEFKCECGNRPILVGAYVKSGKTKSCGCFRDDLNKRRSACAHKNHPSYDIWTGMRARCMCKTHKKFHFYGGRGIKICKRWDSFELFLQDMGPRPSPLHSLDRFPNKNGDYKPSNCRWATQKEQCRNTRRNRMVTIGGVKKCVAEWAESIGVPQARIHCRITRGMDPSEAILKPFTRTYKTR